MVMPAYAIDLSRLRLQWLLGDWSALAALDQLNLGIHPERKALILLATVGNQQCGKYEQARRLAVQSLEWGCTSEELARWMLGGTYCTLGRAFLSIGSAEKGINSFRESIGLVPGGISNSELAQARARHQATLMQKEYGAGVEHLPKENDQDAVVVFQRPSTGIVSYAQNFEDVMLWRALGTVIDGFYVDVGAQDPIVDSVSRAFYEKGWRGIHVEPTLAYAHKIRENRPDEVVIEAAVTDSSGDIKFYEIPNSGISTGDSAIAQGHIVRGFAVQEITVPTITLAEVMESAANREIHWLKVDVEGMEASVLRSWGRSPLRPWIVVVESTLPLTEVSSFSEWEDMLLERGYEHVYFDGLNRFYLHEDKVFLRPAFSSGPNVFDNCILSGLASATFYRRSGG